MTDSEIPLIAKPVLALLIKEPPSTFTAALAHEVRSPLTNINLSIEMLASAIQDPELKLYIDIIMRSSARINDLVIELLKCPIMAELPEEKHSLHELLDEVLEMAGDRIMLKNIKIRKYFASRDHKIILDRPQIKIALTNIVMNALEATIPGKGELCIITKSTDDGCVVRIEDNGCGISENNLKCIFKPFFTGKEGGLGIGLSATNDILQANNVGIHIESIIGKGTQFILMFKAKLDGSLRVQNASTLYG
jgi:signal transduction histidine kinase